MNVARAALVVLLGLFANDLSAQTKPLQPVEVPGWLQDTLGVGYTLSAMDSAQRTAAAEHGVTISEMGFVDPYYPYYDSKLLKKRSPHVPLDRLRKDIAEYKRLGIRILGVYPPTLQGEVYEAHPDWRRIPADTTTIPQVDMEKFGHSGMLCLLGPYGKDSFPPHEILRRMLLCATYGCAPSIAVAQPPRMQQAVYDCLDEMQTRKPWLTLKSPEPWAALVMSDNTKTFYGRSSGQVEERYLANVLGTFRATVEEHLPTAVIEDWNLTLDELKKYAVLILPNAACLDDGQLKTIDEYVRNGGGLVASLDASLFDEFGDPRENFGVADVFGVDFRGLPDSAAPNDEIDVNFAKSIGLDYWEKRRNIFEARLSPRTFLMANEKLSTYVGGDPVTFKGPAVRVKPRDGTTVIGTLQSSGAERANFPAIDNAILISTSDTGVTGHWFSRCRF